MLSLNGLLIGRVTYCRNPILRVRPRILSLNRTPGITDDGRLPPRVFCIDTGLQPICFRVRRTPQNAGLTSGAHQPRSFSGLDVRDSRKPFDEENRNRPIACVLRFSTNALPLLLYLSLRSPERKRIPLTIPRSRLTLESPSLIAPPEVHQWLVLGHAHSRVSRLPRRRPRTV
jgi:hypothetical protein